MSIVLVGFVSVSVSVEGKKEPRPRYNKETEWNTHGCLSLLCMSIPFGLPAVPEV